MSHPQKIFVLDTNVILHDSSCLYQFQENDIVLPITVLEELDQFKKGNEIIHQHAREFVRTLDTLSGDKLFEGGVAVGPGLGRIRIQLDKRFHPDLERHFTASNPDHHVLNAAYSLVKELPQRQVILVSKDVNLRVKAKSVGLVAQDYTTDHVKDLSELYPGHRTVDGISEERITRLYEPSGEVDAESLAAGAPPVPNEYLILRNGKQSVLAVADSAGRIVRRVDKANAYGIAPKNAEQIFALHALMNPAVRLVTLSGKAGTGKTLLALAAALESMKEYRQIYIGRPIVPLSNKDVGFLPGDIQSKLEPYMQPLYDNLGVIKNAFPDDNPKHRKIGELLHDEKLVVAPLTYIRGRSLVRIFFIVDEAQNLTPHEVKTVITRAGEATKMVFTGDIFQIDHPYLNTYSNGLTYLIDRMKGQRLHAHVNLEKGERSELAELASNLL
jgi:PhoH-like ATPase